MSNSTVNMMKDNISSLIYSEVTVEGVGCTFEQTENIITTGETLGLDDWQIQTVLNLKNAWNYLFENYDNYVDVNTILMYNRYIQQGLNSEAGRIRSGTVYVDTRYGRYFPPEPSESRVLEAINRMWDYSPNNIDMSLALLALVAKGQFCSDGNKRTAQLAANHILALNDCECYFCVPDTDEDDFKAILGSFYKDKNSLNETIDALSAYIWS